KTAAIIDLEILSRSRLARAGCDLGSVGSVDGDYLLSPLGASISAIRSRTRLLGLDDDLHDQSFRGETWHADHDASRDSRARSEEHTSELQSQSNLVCRLLLEKKNSK